MGNLPIGQGMAVTPMQMAAAYAAIANGGILRPPRIVKAVGEQADAQAPRASASSPSATASSMRRMLEGVLGPGGTASGAAIDGYVLAGKTGTAEKPDPITAGTPRPSTWRRSSASRRPSSPRLLVAVMVDEPQGEIYGGLVAGAGVAGHHELRAELPQIAPDPSESGELQHAVVDPRRGGSRRRR